MCSTYTRRHQTQPYTVVLTGGVATGKTIVSELFSKLSVPIVDMDVIAHDLVKPGQPAIKQIEKAFGSEFLFPDGSLDRKKMRSAVFSNPELKKKLENILHPLIFEETTRQITLIKFIYCIVVIPLFADIKIQLESDRVLVVDATNHSQVSRLMARDSINHKLATSIIDAQATRSKRLKLADDVITNSGSKHELVIQVKKLHRKYLKLAHQRNCTVKRKKIDA